MHLSFSFMYFFASGYIPDLDHKYHGQFIFSRQRLYSIQRIIEIELGGQTDDKIESSLCGGR